MFILHLPFLIVAHMSSDNRSAKSSELFCVNIEFYLAIFYVTASIQMYVQTSISALSKIDIKTTRMWITKWNYHKELSFASNDFVFSKILFWFKSLV